VLFHVTVFKDAIGWGDQDRPRVRTAAIALVSLTLWFGVGWAGRGIAFF
jgi:hypothetical protein